MATNQPPIRTGLLDFFRNSSGCQFVIPVYQRNYTWTAGKEVKQYLEDLDSVLAGDFENHFLGIMIYLDTALDYSAREFSVIDGQQRLTTTFLSLYAIRSIFKQQGEDDQVNNLEGQYLTNPYSSAKVKYKLKPMVSDDKVYQCIVEDRLDEVKDLESNVYKNFVYIRNYFKEKVVEGQTLNNILMAMNKLYVVCVPIGEEDNAQKIFESINATGVKLTASDLIRNFILMELDSDTQEKYYADYWKKIEDLISPDSKKLESFFRMFLAIKNFNLPNKSQVYREYVKWFKESEKNTLQVLEELVSYADAYYVIYRKDIQALDSGYRGAVREYRRILSEMPAPALMEFYLLYKNGKIDEKQFSEILLLINTYLIRRAVSNYDTSGITRLFPVLLKDVLADCNNNYTNIVEVLKKSLIVKHMGDAMSMPNNDQLFEAVINANMYNIRTTLRVVFDRMELEGNPAPVDLSCLSVEHLMPQTPTKEWLSELGISEDIYHRNLHRLGNLTLAAKTDNSIMGNKVWEYKNAVLKSTSHLKMNEEILKVDKWDVEHIDERTKVLIDKINELYPYPEVGESLIERTEIFIDSPKVVAMGYLSFEDGSVEIDIGSQLDMTYDKVEDYPEIEEMRQELIDDGIIAEIDGKMEFVKPYTIYSKTKASTALSMAANIILHGNRSGWGVWKDGTGILLRDITEIRGRFS